MSHYYIDRPDEQTALFYLEVPGSKVVLLQAYFENYDGVGIVRTISIKHSLVCIMTTPSMANTCIAVLESIAESVPHRSIAKPEDKFQERYLGYSAKGSSAKEKSAKGKQ